MRAIVGRITRFGSTHESRSGLNKDDLHRGWVRSLWKHFGPTTKIMRHHRLKRGGIRALKNRASIEVTLRTYRYDFSSSSSVVFSVTLPGMDVVAFTTEGFGNSICSGFAFSSAVGSS